MLRDELFDQRELRVFAHACLLEVSDMILPPANHLIAARVAQTRETTIEIPHDGSEPGVEQHGKGIGVGEAATVDDGGLEDDLVG